MDLCNLNIYIKEVGIDVPEIDLIKTNDGLVHYAIKRFDRKNDKKFHLHTLASMEHLNFNLQAHYSYLNALKLTDYLSPASGPIRLVVGVDGENINWVDPDIGYVWRALEHLVERKDFVGAITSVERICFMDNPNPMICYSEAVEEIAGKEITRFAKLMRVLLGEIGRCASHLISMGGFFGNAGLHTFVMWTMDIREYFLDVLEDYSGARIATASVEPGGVRYPMPDNWLETLEKAIKKYEDTVPDMLEIFINNPLMKTRAINTAGKLKSATVEYKVDGYTFFSPGIYCDRYDKQTDYLCSIECDGGSFEVDENYNIKTDRVAIYRDDPDAENGGIKELSQKSPKKFVKAQKIQCPKNIPEYDALDDSYYSDHKNGLYVCYDWKYKGKYEGCIRSEKSCKFIHRQHFGKYLNRAESKKALARCKSSKPNKKFVDNKSGLYVCYDYKDKFGQYSGCFRSKTSCKALHKEHFGRYPTTHDSYRAFLRCSSSAPRK
jgi:hypothetical protein